MMFTIVKSAPANKPESTTTLGSHSSNQCYQSTTRIHVVFDNEHMVLGSYHRIYCRAPLLRMSELYM